ncbi:MAG: hypothetical protein IRY87_14115 [Acetobacteraceae bacterium]|nr:hypothetical protein [Acetobacteraceae bacterium]
MQRRRLDLGDHVAHRVDGLQPGEAAERHLAAERPGGGAQQVSEDGGHVRVRLAGGLQRDQPRARGRVGEPRGVVRHRRGQRARVARVGPGDGGEEQRAVLGRAADRADAVSEKARGKQPARLTRP